MRTPNLLAAAAVLAALSAPAFADDVSGNYDVKFEEMATDCTPPPVALARGVVKIEVKKNSLTVNTELIPQMVGVPAKNGKIYAKTNKPVGTTVVGLSGTYSVGGKVDDSGVLQLLLTANYINQKNNKAYCSQSWTVSGVRSASAGDKKATK
jgi:hypothetical protein